jgi:hypothetical protein
MAALFLLAWLAVVVELSIAGETALEKSSAPLRAGIIGLDTSHVVAFTRLLNAANPRPERPGGGGLSRWQP